MSDEIRSEPLPPPLPVQPLNYARPAKPPVPEGLGGWLVLPIIGLFINPIVLAMGLGQYFNILHGKAWPALTRPGSPVYHWLWKPTILMEITYNSVFFAWDILLLILMFQKRRVFPRLMVLFLLTILAIQIVDYAVAQQIPYIASHGNPEGVTTIVRSLIACAIWVPYFLVSKRAKATFVR